MSSLSPSPSISSSSSLPSSSSNNNNNRSTNSQLPHSTILNHNHNINKQTINSSSLYAITGNSESSSNRSTSQHSKSSLPFQPISIITPKKLRPKKPQINQSILDAVRNVGLPPPLTQTRSLPIPSSSTDQISPDRVKPPTLKSSATSPPFMLTQPKLSQIPSNVRSSSYQGTVQQSGSSGSSRPINALSRPESTVTPSPPAPSLLPVDHRSSPAVSMSSNMTPSLSCQPSLGPPRPSSRQQPSSAPISRQSSAAINSSSDDGLPASTVPPRLPLTSDPPQIRSGHPEVDYSEIFEDLRNPPPPFTAPSYPPPLGCPPAAPPSDISFGQNGRPHSPPPTYAHAAPEWDLSLDLSERVAAWNRSHRVCSVAALDQQTVWVPIRLVLGPSPPSSPCESHPNAVLPHSSDSAPAPDINCISQAVPRSLPSLPLTQPSPSIHLTSAPIALPRSSVSANSPKRIPPPIPPPRPASMYPTLQSRLSTEPTRRRPPPPPPPSKSPTSSTAILSPTHAPLPASPAEVNSMLRRGSSLRRRPPPPPPSTSSRAARVSMIANRQDGSVLAREERAFNRRSLPVEMEGPRREELMSLGIAETLVEEEEEADEHIISEAVVEEPPRANDENTTTANEVQEHRFTELDLLVLRLERGEATYEEIQMLSDLMGSSSSHSLGLSEPGLGRGLQKIGIIEVVSRRIDKDGKVKTKFRVKDGVRCNKCMICLCQFRENESVGVLACEHVFHEECICSWLRRKAECPICKQWVGS